MPKVTTKHTVEVTLVLDEQEARVLRDLLQNHATKVKPT